VKAEFAAGHDEMSALVRAFDWSSSELGSPETWPTSLRTIVGVVLSARFPMLIWWGPKLFQIYNDAFRMILGDKHPASFAAAGPKVWSEIWDIVGPMADTILAGGVPTWSEHRLRPMNPKGSLEETAFTLSLSSIPRDDGTVGGVLVTVHETTERVEGDRQFRDLGDPGANAAAREHEARVEAELQKQHLHDLFMQAPTLIAVLRGPRFVVELANEGACRAWNSSQDAILGRPLLEVLPKPHRHLFEPLLRSVYSTGVAQEGRETSFVFERKDGPSETHYFNFVYTPFRGADGRVAGVFVIASDVTDQVRARQQVEDLRRAAESANRAKDEFLAMLGHELRNPLSPIVTALQLMKLRGDGANRERTVIERQVAHLTRLVDDLLDVSRIARGKVELKIEAVEVAEVAVKAIEMASPLLEQRAHALELDVPRRGLVVRGDATRLAQVVSNLLTNAAKYTPAGGRISVTAAAEGEAVILRVRDNGIGISPEVLGHIFDLFVQARQELDRAHGGLGLGLTIVRNLVQLHGGTVSAHSEGIGKGSEFVVRLPLAVRGRASAGGDEGTALVAVSSGNGRRVLVVDDNDDSAAMLAEALRLRGHDVRVAHDGPAALAVSATFHPEVAFLDIGLPVMDGYELAMRMRQVPGLAGVRLLALTGYGQESDSERARLAGFHQHLVKPLDLRQLDRLLVGDEGESVSRARHPSRPRA